METAKKKITGLKAKSSVSPTNTDPKKAITSLKAKVSIDMPSPKGNKPKIKAK